MTYRLVIKSAQIQQEQIILDTQQLHYLLRVLRLGNGDRFLALDGIGNAWIAEIKDRSAQIIQSVAIKTELPICLSLMTALPKASGYEQVIRCCTEIGVSNFIPVISDRTLLKPNSNKVQRWRKIASEAAEQSERKIVPKIIEPIEYIAAIEQIEQVETTQNKYICVARGDIPTLWHSLQQQTQSEILIATGCEGGWTELEVAKAIALGFQPVSLGNRILRAITAPIVASSIVTAVLEAKS
ncbi:16S rRNA (uracil(1498)-N(3))-methyltransferase [Pleurocapsa sp. CCALA 161]|uniref:16S rRNA (uracil(1498)-N(3))-methyltransferase n=1 Tax=Pleurocapsa sp. CCALA 161 TaxID=2107688 RepID=UPI000D06B25F|nr:16S rRNA (uracil(1498)-N(3))-methyltransferase [Pleurocapsa sp. CCALA 161]PSB07020.1 16S rRNA (uracil(1498)-N(3))-methyltransferase [Pleurocapsa sp. CCALA 161]